MMNYEAVRAAIETTEHMESGAARMEVGSAGTSGQDAHGGGGSTQDPMRKDDRVQMAESVFRGSS